MKLTDNEKIYLCSNTALNNKAFNLTILDLKNINDLIDYYIICSGTSTTHVKTIADKISNKMKKAAGLKCTMEGYQNAKWILMDYQDIIVHIFYEEAREYYSLEKLLWNASKIDLETLMKENKDSSLEKNNLSI